MHLVLVHGACHGAWCWFKLKPLLEKAGHQVTAVDLTASGIDQTKVDDIKEFKEYTRPLLDVLAKLGSNEKVVLVGHGFGGISLAFAMEAFPDKIQLAIFLASYLPDTNNPPSYVIEKHQEVQPPRIGDDYKNIGTPENPRISYLAGPQFLRQIYELSPEEFELGMMLKRPLPFYINQLSKTEKFTNEKYGSVKRVYVMCEKDQAILSSFQKWQIENAGISEFKELKGSDHMPMFSMPKQLFQILSEILNEYIA